MANQRLAGMRVAMLTADGFEQVEVTQPRKTLEDHGAEVVIVSIRPGSIRGMNLLAPGKKIRVDSTVFTSHADDYDALVIPGGFIAPDFLRQNDQALSFVRGFDAAAKPIAAICHGPWLLVSAGLAAGRRLTSWGGIQDDIRNAGGIWEDSALVHDGNWISSRSPQDLPVFRRALVEHFARHAPVGVRPLRHQHEEESEGIVLGLGIPGLLVSSLAAAAVTYGLRQLQKSLTAGREEYHETPPAPVRPVQHVEIVEEEVVVVAPREHHATVGATGGTSYGTTGGTGYGAGAGTGLGATSDAGYGSAGPARGSDFGATGGTTPGSTGGTGFGGTAGPGYDAGR